MADCCGGPLRCRPVDRRTASHSRRSAPFRFTEARPIGETTHVEGPCSESTLKVNCVSFEVILLRLDTAESELRSDWLESRAKWPPFLPHLPRSDLHPSHRGVRHRGFGNPFSFH